MAVSFYVRMTKPIISVGVPLLQLELFSSEAPQTCQANQTFMTSVTSATKLQKLQNLSEVTEIVRSCRSCPFFGLKISGFFQYTFILNFRISPWISAWLPSLPGEFVQLVLRRQLFQAGARSEASTLTVLTFHSSAFSQRR